jgi:hypothetical protein
MVDPTLEHQRLGLSGRDLALALTVKYAVLALYGIWAAIARLPTFVIIGSSTFAIGWAATVAALATLALIGIARTWTTGRYRLEKWTTAAFICVFLGYSFALVWRSIVSQDWESTPTALIPLAVCSLPVIRFFSLLVHGRDGKTMSPYREVPR